MKLEDGWYLMMKDGIQQCHYVKDGLFIFLERATPQDCVDEGWRFYRMELVEYDLWIKIQEKRLEDQRELGNLKRDHYGLQQEYDALEEEHRQLINAHYALLAKYHGTMNGTKEIRDEFESKLRGKRKIEEEVISF